MQAPTVQSAGLWLLTAACEWRFLRTEFYGIPTTGHLATAVRFGSRPAPPAGRHLTGQKGLQDVPYESGPVDRLDSAGEVGK